MGDLWQMMKATWKPRTAAEWRETVRRANELSEKYKSPLADAMIRAYIDEMEKESKNGTR